MHVWLTDVSSEKWVQKQGDVSFQTKQTANPLTIKVESSVKYQKVTGFGAALTDSSAWLIDKLPASGRDTLMNKLFDPSNGIGLSMVRLPMGASDFAASGNYSYDDMPAGQTDPTLSKFSIAHDEPYIIPQLKQALALNPSIRITATPWSPPGWMKTSDNMIGGTLKDEYSQALANYFVKFIQAYGKAGVPVHYVTPQNEPLNAPTWPGTALTPSQQITLVQQMGKAFAANKLSTKILAWDHNWDVPSYPESVFNDPATANYAVGSAWHIYSGTPIYQTLTHNDYPGKESYLTEATGGDWQASKQVAFHDALKSWVIDGTRNWANGVTLWNIALDPDKGPLNSDTNGIGICRGLVTIDPKTGAVTYNADYYALAQVSKFVKPGAHRIYSNTFGEGSIEDVAFQNPDGSKVLVAYNDSNAEKTFSVAEGTQSFDYTLGAGDAVTFTYSGPTQNGSTQAATNVTDPNHDFIFGKNDPATVTYDPDLLPVQNGIKTGKDLLTYSLPVGTSVRTPGAELSRSGWTAKSSSSAAGDPAADAIDGDANTRWRSGAKVKSGDWFQLDFGTPTNFNKIVMENTAKNAFDSLAKYQVYVSNDGVSWGSAVADGSGDLGTVAISLAPQTARYVRIVASAPSFFFRWSIGEIKVFGGTSGTASIQAPTSVPKGLELQKWTAPDGADVSVVYNGSRTSQTFPVSKDGSYTYALPSGTSAMFTRQSLSSYPKPGFSSLTPNRGIPGYKFKITGSHFGKTQGLGTVYFGSVHAKIESWTDTSISAYVPGGLASGKYEVSVIGAGGEPAGGVPFTVTGLGTPLDREGWTATASDVSPWPSDVVEHLLDGDTDSRYSSGTGQKNGMWLQVDMKQQQTFNRVVLDSGSSTGDVARSADVYVSSDGDSWTKVSSVTATGQQIELASFSTQTARFLKVINTGSSGNWWSIAELGVYNNTDPDPEPDPNAPLDKTGWAATASDESPWPNDALAHILDGDTSSRYSSGDGQYDGMWIQVDMGQQQTLNKVELDPGSSTDDYARSADVYVSSDGTGWTKVASISGAGQPTQVATFATQTARYLKVVNTGSVGNWWSMAELNVYYDADLDAPLARDGWTATASDESPWPNDALGHLLDGDIGSRYSSGTSLYDGMWIQVDMGQPQTFSKVVLDSGSSTDDYARGADVYVSSDGSGWTKVASIVADGQPTQAVTFPTQTARYLKVVNTGSAGSWWSIAELKVYK
ncbi:discoidin domain-containing protein [Terrabacter sp. MAHUQ-38]|uniref:discoidin domain-containing protein n=1 Tax=unclassified Terrabacter TaxID=2630222 RepID=UPI00165E65DB|nr:discoidin domain-containing protein [Terrabacter sp. MAHUQ-38]